MKTEKYRYSNYRNVLDTIRKINQCCASAASSLPCPWPPPVFSSIYFSRNTATQICHFASFSSDVRHVCFVLGVFRDCCTKWKMRPHPWKVMQHLIEHAHSILSSLSHSLSLLLHSYKKNLP